VDFVDIDN